MAFTDLIPQPTNARLRSGFQSCYGIAALLADMVYHLKFGSHDIGMEKLQVEPTNISGAGQRPRPMPGKLTLTGATVSTQMDVDGALPYFAQPLRKYATTTNLGNGAYRTLIGPSQANDVPQAYSVEVDLDDDYPEKAVDLRTVQSQYTFAVGAALTAQFTVSGSYSSIWKKGVESHPNPHSQHFWYRGIPEEWILRPEPVGDVYIRLVDSSDLTSLKFLGRVGKPGAITGAWSRVSATITEDTSSGAALTEVFAGDMLDFDGSLYTVASVTDDDTIVLDSDPGSGAAITVLQEYGGFDFEVVPGNDGLLGRPIWAENKHSDDGAFMGDRENSGVSLECHMDAATGISSVASAALTGTITTNGTTTVTGAGTAFLTEARIGSVITTNGGEVLSRVVRVASDTSLTIAEAAVGSEAGVAGTVVEPPFVTLTDTWEFTITSTTVTASTTTGAATTELYVGALIVSAAGHQYRVTAITDDDTITIHKGAVATEGTAAVVTDYEWVFERQRTEGWATSFSASNEFPEILSNVVITISGSGLDPITLPTATTVTITHNGGVGETGGIGEPYNREPIDQGFTDGQVVLTLDKVNANIRQAILSQNEIKVDITASTGKKISTSAEEYKLRFISHGVPAGKPAGIAGADANPETLTLNMFEDSTDTDHPDGFQIEMTSDRATPFSTTAL